MTRRVRRLFTLTETQRSASALCSTYSRGTLCGGEPTSRGQGAGPDEPVDGADVDGEVNAASAG
jgi:hypothetical protein